MSHVALPTRPLGPVGAASTHTQGESMNGQP